MKVDALSTALAVACSLGALLACNRSSPLPARAHDADASSTQTPATHVGNQTAPVAPAASCLGITNGVPARPQKFPAIVMVTTNDGLCTGTFVGTNAVLTAAHCLDPSQTNSGAPQDGLAVTTAKGQTIPATTVFFPPGAGVGDANFQMLNDLAILELPANSAPAVMKIIATTPAVGTPFTVAGFGTFENDSDNDTNPDDQLESGTDQVLIVQDGDIFSIGESGTGNQSPAGQNSLGSFGDSGGPLIVGTDIAGTESTGSATLTHQDFAQSSTTFTDASGNPLALPAGKLAAIQQEVAAGRNLATDVHTDLTFPPYVAWLKTVAAQGLDIEFDTNGAAAATTATTAASTTATTAASTTLPTVASNAPVCTSGGF